MRSALRLITATVLVVLLGVPLSPAGGALEGQLLETILVFNNEPTPVMTETFLQANHVYRIVASGLINDWTSDPSGLVYDEAWGLDALYCYAKWRCGDTPQLWRQLLINDQAFDEFVGRPNAIEYNPNHRYQGRVSGLSGQLRLVTADAQIGSWGDNSGYFKVQIVDLGDPYRVSYSFDKGARYASGLTRLVAKGDGSVTFREYPSDRERHHGDASGRGVFIKSFQGPDGSEQDRVEYRLKSAVYYASRGGVVTTRMVLVGEVVESTWPRCRVGDRVRFELQDGQPDIINVTLCGATPFTADAIEGRSAAVSIGRPRRVD